MESQLIDSSTHVNSAWHNTTCHASAYTSARTCALPSLETPLFPAPAKTRILRDTPTYATAVNNGLSTCTYYASCRMVKAQRFDNRSTVHAGRSLCLGCPLCRNSSAPRRWQTWKERHSFMQRWGVGTLSRHVITNITYISRTCKSTRFHNQKANMRSYYAWHGGSYHSAWQSSFRYC